jgi:hypothetical protein
MTPLQFTVAERADLETDRVFDERAPQNTVPKEK